MMINCAPFPFQAQPITLAGAGNLLSILAKWLKILPIRAQEDRDTTEEASIQMSVWPQPAQIFALGWPFANPSRSICPEFC